MSASTTRKVSASTTPEPESSRGAGEPARPRTTLCLGEALVDLICERPVDDLARAEAFVPRFGGAVANAAVVAARDGARVALAGGAGEDSWGRWLRERLQDAGVELSWFELLAGAKTPIALVSVDAAGEPSYQIYGETIATVLHVLGERVEDALSASAALFFGSNTLVHSDEREVTMRARELALELERPVLFDPNLRLHRWRSHAEAAASANACVPGALLVRATGAEAALMTGEQDPERAASALLKAGARMVVLTLGARGAILRGELRVNAPGVETKVRSTIGAGDVLSGILLAKLARSDFYPPALAAALPEAVKRSAQACERWGALE
ncbi:MAG: PfkB family carbohydrate kinase [Solirubrobacteraceae bacterium]